MWLDFGSSSSDVVNIGQISTQLRPSVAKVGQCTRPFVATFSPAIMNLGNIWSTSGQLQPNPRRLLPTSGSSGKAPTRRHRYVQISSSFVIQRDLVVIRAQLGAGLFHDVFFPRGVAERDSAQRTLRPRSAFRPRAHRGNWIRHPVAIAYETEQVCSRSADSPAAHLVPLRRGNALMCDIRSSSLSAVTRTLVNMLGWQGRPKLG